MNQITPLLIPLEAWTPELSNIQEKILLGVGRLGQGLAPAVLEQTLLALEVVNSFYSNRMEGNPTKIADIFEAQEGRLAKPG